MYRHYVAMSTNDR